MNNRNTFIGFILLIIGGSFLFNNLFHIKLFSMGNLWPIFVLGVGLAFEFSFFLSRRAPGLLVPGGILTTIGLLFFFETFTDWKFAAYSWPIYILAVAVGLFQLYLFSGRPKALLIPIGILTTIACASFFFTVLHWFNTHLFGGALLILLGIVFIFGSGKRDCPEKNHW
ncbi:MAG: hypothetical protein N2645_18160 [Clostridia bacterium]|nr:hypothetical protein [Clostridia bacterium]